MMQPRGKRTAIHAVNLGAFCRLAKYQTYLEWCLTSIWAAQQTGYDLAITEEE